MRRYGLLSRRLVVGTAGALLAVGVLCAWAFGAFSAPTISSESVAHVLRESGFANVRVMYFTQIDNRYGEIDTINQAGLPRTVLPPVEAVAYASSAVAKQHYTVTGSHFVRQLFVGEFAGRRDAIPPRFHFSLNKAMSFRDCNVILLSYNGRDDSRLAGRVRRAAHLLHQICH